MRANAATVGVELIATPVWCQAAVGLTAPDSHHPSFTPDHVVRAVELAAQGSELLVASRFEHRYEPQGLSYCVAGHEFTLVLHTWPENGVASLDVMLLGTSARVRSLVTAVETHTGWRTTDGHELERRRRD